MVKLFCTLFLIILLKCFIIGSEEINATEEIEAEKWWQSYAECPLLNIETTTNQVKKKNVLFH